jgi:anaerobic selenocysteine-containing dehydrogenase
LDQHTNCSQGIRAVTAIIAISGNLDAKGGNVIFINARLGKNPIELHNMLPGEAAKKRLGNKYFLTQFNFTKLAHEPSVIKAILEETPYPVKAMLVVASNPMLTSPNSERIKIALEKLDFLAVFDTVMSETAKLADVVLPGCTFLEETYYATYEAGAYLKPTYPGLLMLRPAVVKPLYESRSEWEFTCDLAKRLGYGEYFPWNSVEQAIDYELKPTGITVKKLKAHPEGIRFPGPPFLYMKFGNNGILGKLQIGLLRHTVFRNYPFIYHKYKRMKFMTPSKKVEIYSQRLKDLGYDPLPVYHEPFESPVSNPSLARQYPLILTTGAKTTPYVHSQLRDIAPLNRLMPRNLLEINPETAKEYGVASGDAVRVTTLRSSVTCVASVTDKIIPGVAQLYHGFRDANANALTDLTSLDPITGSAALKSALCSIEKA